MGSVECSGLGDIPNLPLPRLLPQLVLETAKTAPTKTWAAIPLDNHKASAGYEDVSYRRFSYAVDRMAWWLRNAVEPYKVKSFEPLAYIGPPDSRYMIFTLGAIKAGFQMLFLSPRNSDEAQYAVMKEAECQKWLCASEFKDRVERLKRDRSTDGASDLVITIPDQHELLRDEPTAEFPYSKTLKSARYDPLVMLHTSSTTGLPKLIPLNQGYGFHEDIVQHYPPSDGLEVITRKPFDGHCRLFLAMPLFHAGGILLGLLKSLYLDIIMVFQPSGVPLNATVIDGIIRHGHCTGAVLPPYLVEEMCAVPEYFDTLANLKFVQFGSGPLSTACGDTLLTRQKNCPHYIGTTEVGLLPVVELEDVEKEWQYFHFHPWGGIEWRPVDQEESLYELWIKKIPDGVPGLQPVFELFPHLNEWPTRDLYAQHPTKPYLWRARGRADDVLVLSNGEKLNPVDTEGRISNVHPAITGALVVGQGRFQPGLLLEVKGMDPSNEVQMKELVDAIWPHVEAANKVAPKHGQLTRSLILFSSVDKPFFRTPKLSVRRKPTVDLYAEEIEQMYRLVESGDGVVDNADLPEEKVCLESAETVERFILALTTNVTGWGASDTDTDLFILGMDSLHVSRMARALKTALKDYPEIVKQVGPRLIYENPTIGALANAVMELTRSKGPCTHGPSLPVPREQRIQETIDRWTEDLPRASKSTGNADRDVNGETSRTWKVILTGSTGSLGSYLLQTLLLHSDVGEVICLNRSADAADKWRRTSAARGMDPQHQTGSGRVRFLQTESLGAQHFGLDEDVYRGLCREVTHVIHNAWPVNFNLSLASIEKVHIAGVRRMVDFAVVSAHKAKIFFVSSLSSVTSAGLVKPVAEEIVLDNLAPSPMGYGESKFVSERILSAATAATGGEVFTAVLRVGQIAGPDTTATNDAWNAQEWLPSLITSSHTLGVLPETLGRMETVDWIPVNVLGEIIVGLFESSREPREAEDDIHRSRVYHLFNPATVKWRDDLLPIVSKRLGITKVVPLSDWVDLINTLGDDEGRPNPAKKIPHFYQGLAATEGSSGGGRYLTDNTVKESRRLRELGPVRVEWMEKWLTDLGYQA